jgi:hypothetical protein
MDAHLEEEEEEEEEEQNTSTIPFSNTAVHYALF